MYVLARLWLGSGASIPASGASARPRLTSAWPLSRPSWSCSQARSLSYDIVFTIRERKATNYFVDGSPGRWFEEKAATELAIRIGLRSVKVLVSAVSDPSRVAPCANYLVHCSAGARHC